MTPEEAQEIMQAANAPFQLVDQGGNVKMQWDPSEYVKSTCVSGPKALDAVETISNMTWEYAVRIDFETGPRLHVRPGITTRYEDCALWRANPDEACKIADKARTLYPEPVHIIRRLVGEWEPQS